MFFINIIYSIPDILLFLLIFLIMSIISTSCLYLIEKLVPLKFRYAENSSIGYVGATIGVIYAVLAGFIILYVMNNFNAASEITTQEASVAAKLFRNANRLPEPIRGKIQTAIRDYVKNVIDVEWPNMSRDKLTGQLILNKLSSELDLYKTVNNQEILNLQTIFTDIDELYIARAKRIDVSKTVLTGDLWIILIISTLLTIVMNSIVAMEVHLHISLQIVVTLMVSSILFLIIALDRPFLGYFSIKPNIFKTVLMEMNSQRK